MGRPRFSAKDGARREAERAAMADATVKARNIAAEAGVHLGRAVQTEELADKVSRSGAYGDEDGGYPR
ncbi:SIMPL domain-containing protein [Aquabacterium sp. A7-Y]|uniref:SIMPL domain-containing protein n=1 Tax=Aquabacterium sp. A7-Y TaxID=1349605 RepID=UPI0039FC61DD